MPKVYNVDKVGWKPNQLRIWAYLNHRQDIFWPVETWPAWAQQMITLPHKGDSQVFNLAVFLLVNGLNEENTIRWITAQDFQNGQFLEGHYSSKEWNNINKFRDRWRRGLLPLQGKRVYDIASGRPLDAGEYKSKDDRVREEQEFGNRITTVLTIGGDPVVRVYPEEQRFESDDWIG